MQGLALGLNAGLGNAGVSVMQFLIPWAITFGMFGGLGRRPAGIPSKDGNTLSSSGFKTRPWSGFPDHDRPGHPGVGLHEQPSRNTNAGRHAVAIGKYLWLQTIGFLGAAVGVVHAGLRPMPVPELVRIFLVLDCRRRVATLLGMRFMTPQTIQEPLNKQFAIFKQQTQLGHDLALRDDLRLVHRLRQRVSQAD